MSKLKKKFDQTKNKIKCKKTQKKNCDQTKIKYFDQTPNKKNVTKLNNLL